MKIWPRSLFGRLTLLLLAVLLIAIAVTILLFRQDRAALVARQFGDTMIVQLKSLRAALATVDPEDRRDTLRRIGREYNVRIVPEDERPVVGGAPPGPLMAELEYRLRDALGDGTTVRLQPRLQLFWVRIAAGGTGYWVGFPLPSPSSAQDMPSRAALWSAIIGACLLLAAFLFARYLAHPLRELNSAVLALGRGEMPEPLPESGPSEIANLNRGFNRMLFNLRQLEQDRALLLAGVSHDLRTPLARLRLGVEISVREDTAKREMSDDIAEMDRIIGQFLDFARNEQDVPAERQDPEPLIAGAVERYRRAGHDVRHENRFRGTVPVRATAFSRLIANLLDNALAYGAPPVEVVSRATAGDFLVEVIDRGPGIPVAQVERLKQPFTRASAARAHAGGVAGAGLGLAIVERIARLHGGSFDLAPREGGGTIARVTLPGALDADAPASSAPRAPVTSG